MAFDSIHCNFVRIFQATILHQYINEQYIYGVTQKSCARTCISLAYITREAKTGDLNNETENAENPNKE